MLRERTIRKTAEITGIGLHSGAECSIKVKPASAGSGLRVVKPGQDDIIIPVHANNVSATQLATTLSLDEVSVSTVEHCLSALAAFRIDNAIIEISDAEVPIGDGSALPFAQAIFQSGFLDQDYDREYMAILRPVFEGDDQKHAYVVPYNGLRITATIDFSHPMIGEQNFSADINEKTFLHEIAPARTFGFLQDVEKLQAMGLARGGSLDNALVFDETKLLNPEGFRFENECVRHKVLDALGDLATLGGPLLGHVVLYKAGHDLLNKLVKKILDTPDSFQPRRLAEVASDAESSLLA